MVKLADSLEIAFIRLTLQYFFSSIARLRVVCRFFFENAISAIRLLFSIRALHRLQSWKKYMGNLYPLPPNQGWENGAFWLLCSFILDLAGMGVRCFILFCPRLQLPQLRMFLLGCLIDFCFVTGEELEPALVSLCECHA